MSKHSLAPLTQADLEAAVSAERERILSALAELMIRHDVIADHAVVTARTLEQFIARMRAAPIAINSGDELPADRKR